VRTLQLKDNICKVYIDYLEKGILPSDDNLSKRVILSSPYYLIKNGVLYKIPVTKNRRIFQCKTLLIHFRH
jgi:Holliday junction resolvase RusA-like endonuclease